MATWPRLTLRNRALHAHPVCGALRPRANGNPVYVFRLLSPTIPRPQQIEQRAHLTVCYPVGSLQSSSVLKITVRPVTYCLEREPLGIGLVTVTPRPSRLGGGTTILMIERLLCKWYYHKFREISFFVAILTN